MSTPDAAATVVRPEPWTTVAARYAAGTLGALGVGTILHVVLGRFWGPEDWGGLVDFALVLGAWIAWGDLRSSDRPHRGRRLVLIAVCALALYLLGSKIAHDAQVSAPVPTGVWGLAFGLLAVAGSLLAIKRLDADEV